MIKAVSSLLVCGLVALQGVVASDDEFVALTELPVAVAGAWTGGYNDCEGEFLAGNLSVALSLKCGPGAIIPAGFESFTDAAWAGPVTTASCGQDVQRGMANGVIGTTFTQVNKTTGELANSTENICLYYQRFQAKSGTPSQLRIQIARAPVTQTNPDAVTCYAQMPKEHLDIGIQTCFGQGASAVINNQTVVVADDYNCVNALQASCKNKIQSTINHNNIGMSVGAIGLIVATGIATVVIAKINKVQL